jgi:hypothetical protein
VNLSLDKLGEIALRHAESVLIAKDGAQLVPTFHIQFTDRPPVTMPVPWTNDRQKAALLAAVRSAIKEFRSVVDSYSFITEAWIATQDTPPRAGDLLPSEREDRREAVIITAFNKDTGFMRTYEIKRGPDARVTALVAEREPDRFQGRIYNLFEDE